MRTVHGIRRHTLFLFVPLVFVLTLLLAACGTNGTTTGGSNPTAAPTNTPTTVTGFDPTSGCPSRAVVGTAPAKANVTVQFSDVNKSITATNGDIIEVHLPFGQQWNGPTTSQGVLELQTPSGYANTTDKMCVWRFIAKGSGTVDLTFYAHALCKKGAMCAQYIMDVPFTIVVK